MAAVSVKLNPAGDLTDHNYCSVPDESYICSSRFTDSGKYEDDCLGCFKLESARIGEICNACVLIVKRWKKLPANTSKDWAHVVDAR